MASLNKVQIMGNLGQDPEIRYMPDGTATATLSIATTETWKDKASGEKKERTEWHRVVFYRRAAEVIGEHCKKGSALYVEGKIRTRKWTDKDQIDRYTVEIIGDEFQFLGTKQKEAGKPPAANEGPKDGDYKDEIPF